MGKAAGAESEMIRALAVLGATLHDLGDLVQAESLLVHASEFAPQNRDHQDRWRLLHRLGDVLQAQNRSRDAIIVFRQTISAAESGDFGGART